MSQGKPKTITADMVKEGVVVIDVGANRLPTSLVGDVDFEVVKDKAKAITPVPLLRCRANDNYHAHVQHRTGSQNGSWDKVEL